VRDMKDGDVKILEEIKGAKLPDAKFTLLSKVEMSFTKMLEQQVQAVRSGQMSASTFYQSLDNMMVDIQFFRNLVILEK